MTAAHLSIAPRALEHEPPTEIDVADDIVPVVGVVFEAGPPAYVIAAFGAVITLLACFPPMILAVVLAIGLVLTAALAGLAAVLVVVPWRLAHWRPALRPHPRAGASRSPTRGGDVSSVPAVTRR